MDFPDRDLAATWVGRTVMDRDGTEIGACTAVFTDEETQLTEWVCTELAGAAVFIPAVGAAEADGRVRVAVLREAVAAAPAAGGPEHISTDDEAALYRHYGISHSRDASGTLLADGTHPAPGTEPSTGTGTGTGTEPGDTRPSSGTEPTDGTRSSSDTDWSSATEPGTGSPSGGGRRRVVLAGLAGAASVAGAVLGARRLRQPPSRTERLARGGRAASAATAGRLATSAVAVRRHPGPVTAAVTAVLSAVALRRRRSGGRAADQPVELVVVEETRAVPSTTG